VSALRLIPLLASIAIAALGLSACGGSSSQVVAQVAGVGSVTRATLDHWIPIEAHIIYDETGTKPVPKGVMPDPPSYTACVAYLKTVKQSLAESGPKPTVAQLRTKCAQEDQNLKVYTLNTLIDWVWTIGNGDRLGMSVSEGEAHQRLLAIRKGTFPKESEFKLYLARTGETVGDMLYRAKIQLFEAKLQQKQNEVLSALPKGVTPQQQERALANFAKRIPTLNQWAAKTNCHAGFVTSDCKQYKGPLAVGTPN
jgi:foldase protein PrsA